MKIICSRDFKLNNTCVTLGKFDGIHKGHRLLIDSAVAYAKDLCSKGIDAKSVVFTLDLARKSIYTMEKKLKLIEECGVDVCIVYPFDEMTMNMEAQDFIENVLVGQLGTKHIVVGEDFAFGHGRKGNVKMLRMFAEKSGYEVDVKEKISIDDNIVSSTFIKECLDKGDVKNAGKYLGRNYSIEGRVIHGKQLGRTIGFPTANIDISEDTIVPKLGVYDTRVYVDDKEYKGITNIGHRPTVDGGNVNVETNIFGFDKDIYGKTIKVDFVSFIRGEKKFASVDELKEQIKKDYDFVLRY